MKEIEGINLASELANANVEILQDKAIEIRRKIGGILGDFEKAGKITVKAEKALKDARDKELKLHDKIEKIKAGDWSVLEDEKEKKE